MKTFALHMVAVAPADLPLLLSQYVNTWAASLVLRFPAAL